MKKKQSADLDKVVRKSLDFESTLVDVRRKNEKRAWMVAGVSTFISICLIGGLFYVLPLKEKEPYLVMADAYTGQATVAKLKGNWGENNITMSEAVNKSNITHFVIARESFDSQLIYDNDWAVVYAMSVPSVSNTYRNTMNKGNPNSPFNVYGPARSIRVKILSIVLNNSGKANGRDASATVRFQRFILDKANGSLRYIDSNVATLTYTYNSNLEMDEKYRMVNPLGFQVTSYRVDPDTSTSIPKEGLDGLLNKIPEIGNNLSSSDNNGTAASAVNSGREQ
ncbi:MAG: type IV secretion system protein [Neisseria sp.]|uniref:virB8 family protein n=1 Tax=Neisseria sp. TaxID=192066 RepID=UPI0026DACD8B|nr:type IV secretion system protein [Neisseria sp.]MDO4640700.1 type IV secretion system protein [Neisseria sp.]